MISEKSIPLKSSEGCAVTLRRISLGQRLKFMQEHSKTIGRINFLSASSDTNQAEERLPLELEVCKGVLRECVIGLTHHPNGEEKIEEWLINRAPQSLCIEVLSLALDEFVLSDERAKN